MHLDSSAEAVLSMNHTRPGGTSRPLIIGAGVSAIVLAICCAIAFKMTQIPATLAVSGATALAGILSLWFAYRPVEVPVSTWGYELRSDGLLRIRPTGTVMIHWKDMASVTFFNGVVRSGSLATFADCSYRIVTAEGEKITIDCRTRNYKSLGETIVRETNRRRLEAAAAVLASGGSVAFGELSVSRGRLGYKGDFIDWKSCPAAGFEMCPSVGSALQMVFIAQARDRAQPFCAVPVGSIPFALAFGRLLEDMGICQAAWASQEPQA